jgi:hypothetical protein
MFPAGAAGSCASASCRSPCFQQPSRKIALTWTRKAPPRRRDVRSNRQKPQLQSAPKPWLRVILDESSLVLPTRLEQGTKNDHEGLGLKGWVQSELDPASMCVRRCAESGSGRIAAVCVCNHARPDASVRDAERQKQNG